MLSFRLKGPPVATPHVCCALSQKGAESRTPSGRPPSIVTSAPPPFARMPRVAESAKSRPNAPPPRRKEPRSPPAVLKGAKSPVSVPRPSPKSKSLPPEPSFSGAKVPVTPPKGSSSRESQSQYQTLCQEHEALQARFDALQRDHSALKLKHDDSVRSCRMLLDELKERPPPEPTELCPSARVDKAQWRPLPAAVQSWPPDPANPYERTEEQLDRHPGEVPAEQELSIEPPPADFVYVPTLSSRGDGDDDFDPYTEDEDDEDEGRLGGGEYGDEYGDEGLSPPEVLQLIERFVAQEQLVAELNAQISGLTTELVRKAKRDDAIVIHVSPEMW